MINVLLEGHNLTEQWLCCELKKYIKPHHRVTIIPFSFRDSDVSCTEDWERLFGKRGYITGGICKSLEQFGIDRQNISVIDYFNDTPERAANKVKWADIIYFPGGLPHKIMERIHELGLYGLLASFDGIVMGNSAGALIQLSSYHLSPDKDYPEFGYYEGLPYINDFYLEVHYSSSDVQNLSVKRVLDEKKKRVYATSLMAGAIIVENKSVTTVGKVSIFDPQ